MEGGKAMSTPSHNDRMELEIFDSFSKTVMRNTGRNIASASKTIETNETVSTDTVQYILKTQGEREIYPSEYIINDGNGHSCVITTEWLYQAMLLLTDKQKEVIILEFWYGMSVSDISETLHIFKRSVFERKKNAFNSIRNYYERNQK